MGKMIRGQFSTSSRVVTFMSTLSQFNVEVRHIKGIYNLPSDFHSRHPAECDSQSCQICKSVSKSDSVVARGTSVDKILAGQVPVPYANRASWRNLQMDCPDLRRVHAHLSQGTIPNAKKSKQTEVKRCLCKVTISRDGLLVVRSSESFLPEKELIVVP